LDAPRFSIRQVFTIRLIFWMRKVFSIRQVFWVRQYFCTYFAAPMFLIFLLQSSLVSAVNLIGADI
jgi:hypothetical protein